jgi:small conductance mechanosensitive channel
MAVLTDHKKVLKSPEPYVGVSDLSSSSITLVVRPYCKPADYWDVYFDTYENVKLALDKACVEIPFPHVVHINQ